MSFWQSINHALDRIESEQPATVEAVAAILNDGGNPDGNSLQGVAFFGGSGGDRTLRESLRTAGWRTTWAEASYYYRMQSPTGDVLEYVEGDVYDRTAAAVTA